MKKNINSIDIETFGKNELVPYCCCVIYRSRVIITYGSGCVEKMIKLLSKICENSGIFYAHNLTFDGGIIISKLPRDFTIESNNTSIIKGNIYSLCIKHANSSIIFRCSYRLIPMKLSEISIKLNISKKLNIDHNSINKNNYNNISIKNSVIEYCKRDVEIVQIFISQLDYSIRDVAPNWRYFTYSIAGIALLIFKTKFKNNFTLLKTNIKLDNAVRSSYYGGRCEVFGNPLDDDYIFHYDFSGMYTNRLTEEYPCGKYWLEVDIDKVDKPGFYSVTVLSKDFDIPILPYRCEKTNKLLFPNGVFSGVYWYEELNLFTENKGIILKYNWAMLFEKTDKIFENFASYCKNMRKKSALNKIIWKLIPNSFIGRMGLRPEYEKTLIISNTEYDPRKYNVISDKKVNNIWIVRVRTCLNNIGSEVSGNVVYAAVTTAKARILWWKAAQDVIKNKGRLLYCDTDSLFVAFKKDVSNEQHGIIYWDTTKNDTIIDKACFATSKAYSVIIKNNNETKIKGVPKNSLTYKEFCDDFYNKNDISVSVNFFAKNETKFVDIIKNIQIYKYDKRIFSTNKKFTKPIWVNEDTLNNEWDSMKNKNINEKNKTH